MSKIAQTSSSLFFAVYEMSSAFCSYHDDLADPLKRVEEECLKLVSNLTAVGEIGPDDEFKYVVKTPKGFYFDEGNNTQIQEYLAHGIDLKTYALNTYPASTSQALKPQCYQLGRTLGKWLRDFHKWSAQQLDLRQTVTQNYEIQQLKHTINFGWLLQRVEQYPTILEEAKVIFEEVKKMAVAELEDEDRIQVIHGDFWTGK